MIQQTLFDKAQEVSLTIDIAADALKVSTASIRNWIKTGYLEKSGRNEITAISFRSFKDKVIGKDKLTKRANKSLKDHHDHDSLEKHIAFAFDNLLGSSDSLSDLYESSLSESYKNNEGVFYTPIDVADKFFEYLPEDCSELTFCDPCCGTGNFLVAAVKKGFRPSNVYGFDIDKTALEIARKRMSEYVGGNEAKISYKDFLDESYQYQRRLFDVVFTNPPWGKKLAKRDRDVLAKVLNSGNSKDTSAIFFFACLKILKASGFLGLLLQDAFFNIATFESARRKALQFDIKAFIDFGRPFQGLLTKAKGIVLRNESPDKNNMILCEVQTGNCLRPQEAFGENLKSIFNFVCSKQDADVIEHLLGIEHKTLEGAACYGLGIVTGNNKRYCSTEIRDGDIPIYKGSDITRSGLKSPSTFIPADLSLYQQVAPINLYQSEEKLIYKFISSELVFFHDTEQRFILNSANMLVLDKSFPLTNSQLCALLNSKLMSWIFSKLFETHKVLRADLESLPIYVNYFNKNKVFSEKSFLDFLSLEEVTRGSYRVKK